VTPSIDTSPRIERPDDFYQLLINAHAGLEDEASTKLNAKLVLVLANQVGDMDILGQAIELARDGIVPTQSREIVE